MSGTSDQHNPQAKKPLRASRAGQGKISSPSSMTASGSSGSGVGSHNQNPTSSNSNNNNPSIIATPPRAALQGRQHNSEEESSKTSTIPTPPNTTTKPSTSKDVTSSSTSKDSSPLDESTPPALPVRSSNRTTKDTRIAELEQDLANITTEFSHELTSLSQRLTNESESAAFWQQKHTSLHQTFLKTDTDLRLLRSQQSLILSQQEERDRDIKTRISSLMLDRDAFREAYNEAMAELRSKEEEVRTLQGQVRGLKSWVSSTGSNKGAEQVTDEAFGEAMQRLGNGLQNWVITNCRRIKIDLGKTDAKTRETLSRFVPTYEGLVASSKIHLIQSFVSRIIVNEVFEAYFVGLPNEEANELERVENKLGSYGTAENMNQWRSTTLAILRKDAPASLAVHTVRIVEQIVQQVNSIMTSISDIAPSEPRDQSLRALINSSIDLSRLLRVQKAIFSVAMPCIEEHQRTMFDAESMEDIGGEDEDTLNDREIQCVTFPGIVKSGDENGEKTHLKNVVAKIRVLCTPD